MKWFFQAAMHGHTVPNATPEALCGIAEALLGDEEFRNRSTELRAVQDRFEAISIGTAVHKGGKLQANPTLLAFCPTVTAVCYPLGIATEWLPETSGPELARPLTSPFCPGETNGIE